jgi:hypothetical protein
MFRALLAHLQVVPPQPARSQHTSYARNYTKLQLCRASWRWTCNARNMYRNWLIIHKLTKVGVIHFNVPWCTVNKTSCHILSDACTQCGIIAQYHIRLWTQNNPKVIYRVGHIQNCAILSLLKDWRKSKSYTSFSSCLCKEHNSRVYNASLHDTHHASPRCTHMLPWNNAYRSSYSFIYNWSTWSNLQCTSQFFYVTCNMLETNNL